MGSSLKSFYINAILLAVLAATMSGCSWFSSKLHPEQARGLPPLEVPPDLIRPYSPDKAVEPVVAETESDEAAGEATDKKTQSKECRCDDQTPKMGEAVLPPGKGVQRFRDGQHRWLLVSVEPEQLWPLAKEFLERRGYQISRDEPAVGLLETDWKNRFDSTDEQGVPDVRERLRFRLEPGQQTGSTEVYLSQYGSERIASAGESKGDQWRLLETDNDRAVEMLNRFARFLAGEKLENAAALSSMASHLDSNSDGGSVLVVEAEFEKVWRRTAIALDALGFVIEDKDRATRMYRVYNDLPTGKTEEELRHGKPESATVREEYRIKLDEEGGNTLISIRDESGQTDNSEVAQHVLNLLRGQFQ